jgi:2-polyprenyl-3-methyl-5-hydroxy-6-metoxy-1,4-benzoquinol methylase
MTEFESLQAAANSNTAEGLDYYWANVDMGRYFNDDKIGYYYEVLGYCRGIVNERQRNYMVDLGCGPGKFLQMFMRAYPYVKTTGIDYAASAIEYVRENITPHAIQHDLILPRPTILAPAHYVFCMQTLEHIEQWQQVVTNIFRYWVRPYGHVFLTVPNGKHDRIPQHINRWTFQEFGDMLQPYGKVEMRYISKYGRMLAHVRKGK